MTCIWPTCDTENCCILSTLSQRLKHYISKIFVDLVLENFDKVAYHVLYRMARIDDQGAIVEGLEDRFVRICDSFVFGDVTEQGRVAVLI